MSDDTIQSVADAPVCLGCGFASQPDEIGTFGGICADCFNRRNGWQGGGMIRVVTRSGYHETARCPAVKNAIEWWHWKDETAMYEDMAGNIEKCSRCHSHRTFGFDHYRGKDKTVIGHA